MLDLDSMREALTLIKKGCKEIKLDKSKSYLIVEGLSKLNEQENHKEFVLLVCAVANEKLGMYANALNYYDLCISVLPESSIQIAIMGMKFRTLAKSDSKNSEKNIKLARRFFKKASAVEQNAQMKEWWELSILELNKML